MTHRPPVDEPGSCHLGSSGVCERSIGLWHLRGEGALCRLSGVAAWRCWGAAANCGLLASRDEHDGVEGRIRALASIGRSRQGACITAPERALCAGAYGGEDVGQREFDGRVGRRLGVFELAGLLHQVRLVVGGANVTTETSWHQCER